MGEGWVLCNGQDISQSNPKSKWIQVTGNSRVPDCAGKFIRTLGGESMPLGETQADATAVNNMSASSSTSLAAAMSVTVSGTLEGQLDTRGHSDAGSRWFWGNGGSGGKFSIQNGAIAGGGFHEIFPRVSGSMHGNASGGSWSTSTQLKSSDSETRPLNITVNTFIKVD
ncbi:hypothetical protein [Oligoflexus tunisiensis]|uniref:hypothetical protein n=1 Tax=Oligoflexus tunisiensis TaxID=708132 RepID=UPI001C40243F|nr:hypothetical protein [Oligoflexus tunisiensis]